MAQIGDPCSQRHCFSECLSWTVALPVCPLPSLLLRSPEVLPRLLCFPKIQPASLFT